MAAEAVGLSHVTRAMHLNVVPDPSPENTEQERRLQEKLRRAHEATRIAQETIEEIAEELRFPLAFSTRIHDERQNDDAGAT